MSTINLTQHPATADQIAAGVLDLPAEALPGLRGLLTFGDLPDAAGILARAEALADLACAAEDAGLTADQVMIGGALWLMAPLANALRNRGHVPVFAFSVRETEEHVQPDGSVRKVAVFKHAGFVPAVA